MAVSEPKKKMTKDEIIDILRRNARLFKDEADFVAYIVDLAMYLLENCLEESVKQQPAKAEVPPFKATKKEVKEVLSVFDRFSSGKTQVKHRTPVRSCHVCGAPVHGKRRCPNCNAMTF